MVGIANFLGDISGKQVLEYGCRLGEIRVLPAISGAHVTTFDISRKSVLTCRQRAKINSVDNHIQLSVAAGANLPYADESFDVVFGKAILHHLDADRGWLDLNRVLKPGGKAVFVEPMGMNPVLSYVCGQVPDPEKNPRGADCPLNYAEIDTWGRGFCQFC